MKRCCKVFACFLAALLALVLLTAAVTLAVPALQHRLLAAAVQSVPGLSVQAFEGPFYHLTLKGVSYKSPAEPAPAARIDMTASRLALDINCRALLQKTLALSFIEVEGVKAAVTTAPSAHPAEPVKPEPINTDFKVALERLTVKDVHATVNGTAVKLGESTLAARFAGQTLTIDPWALSSLRVTLPVASATPAAPAAPVAAKPVNERLKALFSRPLITLDSLPDGPLLPLTIVVKNARFNDLELTDGHQTLHKVQQFTLEADANPFGGRIHSAAADYNDGSAVVMSARADLHDPATGRLSASLVPGSTLRSLPVQALRQTHRISLKAVASEKDGMDLKVRLFGKNPAVLTASVDPQLKDMPFEVSFFADRFEVSDTVPVSENVRAWARGRPSDFTLGFTGRLTPTEQAKRVFKRDLGKIDVRLKTRGNFDGLTIKSAGLKSPDGSIAVVGGKAVWGRRLTGDVQLALVNFELGTFVPSLPARLSGQTGFAFDADPDRLAQDWRAKLTQLTLTGKRSAIAETAIPEDVALTLSGNMQARAGGFWQIEHFNATVGDNHLTLDGSGRWHDPVTDTFTAAVTLQAPDFSQINPAWRGHAGGQIHAGGRRLAPSMQADVKAADLAFDEDSVIEALRLSGQFSATRPSSEPLTLVIDNAAFGKVVARQTRATLSGIPSRARLHITTNATPVGADLTLTGGFNRDYTRFKGRLENAGVVLPSGTWRTSRADYLVNVTNGTVLIEPHTWTHKGDQLRLKQQARLGKSGSLALVLDRLNLAGLSAYLPSDIRFTGFLSGTADARWNTAANGRMVPTVNATLTGHRFEWIRYDDLGQTHIPFNAARLQASLNTKEARLRARLTPDGFGKLAADVAVLDPARAKTLSGEINFDALSIALADAFMRTGEKATGRLDGHVSLGGSVSRPALFGRLDLTDALVKDGLVPVVLKPSQARLSFNGTRSEVSAQIHTAQGPVNIAGAAVWSDPTDPLATLSVQSPADTPITVMVPPAVRLGVVTDVRLKADKKGIDLQGHVDIPFADIVVKTLPGGAIEESPDLVLLNRQMQPVKPKSAKLPIRSALTINLGEKVKLDAFGLRAGLGGKLHVLQNAAGLGLTGQVNLTDGRFMAYGQDLLIRHGDIIFAGPINQPFLNLEAVRNPEATENNVTAGLRVSGSAKAPIIKVFSEPTMSQGEALSYLLRGQGLGSSGSDGEAVATALLGMGLSQTSNLVGTIGRAFGIEDLGVGTQGVGENTQVVVSGHILPDLELKYGVGLFDALATFTLRYRLYTNLYLQAVSGLEQSCDVLYHFEFN